MADVKLSESVMQAVRSGQKVRAIKQLRMEAGIGLKEAKEIIDSEIAAYNLENPHAPIVEESSRLPAVIVIVLIAVAVYLYLGT